MCIAGAWHTTEILEPLKQGLVSAGYSDIRLLSAASVPTPIAASTAIDHISFVRAELEKAVIEESKDVVIVAHSYGGLLACSAAKGLLKSDREAVGKDGGIIRMVFIAAFCLLEGESVGANAYKKKDTTPEEEAANYSNYEFKVRHFKAGRMSRADW